MQLIPQNKMGPPVALSPVRVKATSTNSIFVASKLGCQKVDWKGDS